MTEHDTPLDTPDFDANHVLDTLTPWTVDEVLELAALPEGTASVCLKPNLQAEYDCLMEELTTLVDASGKVIDEADAAAGEKSAATRAHEVNDRMREVRREMAAHMWRVTFRAMPSDDWSTFSKRFKPKDPKADHTDFYNRLVCETAISPTITMEQLQHLRRKLGPAAIGTLITTAHTTCVEGGIDVPKLPYSSRNLEGARSGN